MERPRPQLRICAPDLPGPPGPQDGAQDPPPGRPEPPPGRPEPPPGGPPDALVAALTPEQAFRRYCGYVAAIAFRLLGRDDEVDDVVQDVFLAAMKGLAGLRDSAAARGWLATVTVRLACRRLRVRGLRLMLGLDHGPRYAQCIAPVAGPEDRVLLGQIYSLLDELPVAQRVAWTLRYVQDEPLDEVARLCGCSLSAAKRRIEAAHQAIRKMLSDG